MDHILRVIRISSKKWFKLLKERSPYICNKIENNVKITNIFLKHISWYKKPREIKEIIIRLWMMNLIEDILQNWNIVEKRDNVKYEWKIFTETYKISYLEKWIYFIVIIWKKDEWDYILLSCYSKIL